MAGEVCVESLPQPLHNRHSKHRPLGVAQPRQRCHTNGQLAPSTSQDNIDICVSSRASRAKTASKIIAEQQQQIHGQYCVQSRKVKSAPATFRRRHSKNAANEQQGKWALKSLYVKGIKSGTQELIYQCDSKRDAKSTKQTPRISSGQTNVKSTVDPELECHYNAFIELNSIIRDKWQTGCHDDLGADQPALRPKPYSAGHDAIRRRGFHWMSERGETERSKSAGNIDDYLNYATMNEEPLHYYSIDRLSGIHTPKPLKPDKSGSRFWVGVNGAIRSIKHKVSRRRKISGSTGEEKQEDTSCEDGDAMPPEPVPLCWSDQLSRPGSKIIEARRPRTSQPSEGIYERHAVVFQSQRVRQPMPRSLSNGIVDNGYRVKSRSNSYRGVLGRSSSKIIHISIDRKTADEEEEIQQLSYDKILDTYRDSAQQDNAASRLTGSVAPVFPKVEYEPQQLLFGELPDPDARKASAFHRASAANGWSSRPISVPSGRPATAMSHLSSYDFESEMWMIDGMGCGTPSSAGESRGFSGRGQRLMQIHQTAATKPAANVHKPTAVASTQSTNVTTEYIQFAHKMQLPKEFIPTKSRAQTKPAPPPPRAKSPTISPAGAQQRKAMIMTPASVVPPPAPPASIQDATTASPEMEKRQLSLPLVMKEQDPPTPVIPTPVIPPPVTPPPVIPPPVVVMPNVKYAFNIPTAEVVAESETNSLTDGEEFAVNVPVETELTDKERFERDIEDIATKVVTDVLSRLVNEGDETQRSTTFLTADD